MSEIYFTSLCTFKSNDWLLWSNKISWDTSKPDITLCFQYTILNWIPLLYLWISSMIYIPILLNKPSYTFQNRGKFNIFKTILISLLLLIHILNLFVTINESIQKKYPPPAMYLQTILSGISSILLIYLNRLVFKKALHTSGVLFFYWLFQFIVNVVIIYSRYNKINIPNPDNFRTVTATLEFLLNFTLFIANCFSDLAVFANIEKLEFEKNFEESQPLLNLSSENTNQHQPNPCPKSRASFLSQLTSFWLTNLIIQGYRKALTFNDLFDLLEEDKCRHIVPRIEREWNREIDRVEFKTLMKKPKNKNRFSTNYQALKFDDDTSDEETEQNHKMKNRKTITPSFLRSLFHTVGYPYVITGIYRLIYDLLSFVQPQFLGLFIAFIENSNEYLWHGLIISVGLFIVSVIRSIIAQQYYQGCYMTGMRARTAVIGIIYRKALKLSSTSRKKTTVGEIVNLMSVDTQKLQDVPNFLHLLWTAPIMIIIAIYFLWQELGASVLAGVGLMICLIPINGIIGSKIKKLQNKQMKMKDNRIKLISEILSGIKILKLYAWENSFEENIESIRNNECVILRSATYLNAFSAVTWFCAPFLVALFSFMTYVLSSPTNVLTPNKAFVSLTLFNILNIPMTMLPGTIVYGIQAYVSLVRINKFLIWDELDPDNIEISALGENPVRIINGTFSWEKSDSPALKEINMEVPEGSLVAIVGTVGSGKTTLISALIGELYRVSGRVIRKGSVAYIPQQAWCQNASFQDNILFNKPMVHHKYNRVIEACALNEDLKILPAGDKTEIGEKGVNLSGGQKQRISLARAVYQDCSVYLFDDPLSAVDSHVGKHIFENVIGPGGLLSSKTRILVTHGLTYLPKVDNIFVMKDGKISESGTFKELVKNNGPFADFIRTYLEQEEEEGENEDSGDESRELKNELKRTISKFSSNTEIESEEQKLSLSNNLLFESKKSHRRLSSVRLSKSKSVLAEEEDAEKRKNKKNKLIEEEIVETGGVKMSVFISYLRSATFTYSLIVILSYSLFICCSVGANMFLSYWAETGSTNGTQNIDSQGFYLGIYGSLGLGQTIFVLIENFALAYGTFLASKSLHSLVLKSILRAPNSFFDTTPLGRILNRIGKDIDTVDVSIPTTMRMWLATVSGVISSIIVISISSPYFIIALIPLSIMYYVSQRFYICTSRQLKRIDSIKRSPIYSHFQESIIGASSIRAYKVSSDFINKCDVMTDENQMAWYPNIISYRWLQFNLETIGNIIILLTAILAALTKSTIGSGYAGLSLTYALQITGSLNFMVRVTSDLESYTVAVERIKEYAEIESEAPWNIEDRKPPSDWPNYGKVVFNNYSVRYRPGLELVLRNLNFSVAPGEKLGIVGRTGAGKSSLALAIFRLIEAVEGSIIIDNININQIGLHDLRSKITIIPQDPVLFSGTLRMNLDPFGKYSDGELWSSLDMSHLKSFVSKTPEGLNFIVSESGENLSVGQRQLVCLARALLKKTKVLVLDEATAAVDLETDDLIQNSIRRQFKSCTVLTIAHRLNTIMDYDRVMVLDQGRIRELDTPQKLLEDNKSIFFQMARDAGLV